MDMTRELYEKTWKMEPFPPGTYESYSIRKDGTTTKLQFEQFYTISSKPASKPFIPYDGM